MNKSLAGFLRRNVVPICLFPNKKDVQEYDVDFKVIGTGFNIATLGKESIIITASHLSESFEVTFDSSRHDRSIFFPETKKEAILYDTDEVTVFFDIGSSQCRKADVIKGGFSDTYDISLLHTKFRHESHVHLSQIAIDSRRLDINQDVYIFAFSDLKYTTGAKLSFPLQLEPFDFEDAMYHRFEGDIETIHTGKITDIHENFRGTRYEVNIPVKSGMSGGLVFYMNSSGKPIACGVVSSSFADSSTSSDTAKGHGCFVTPINDILNIPLLDDGQFPEYVVLGDDGKVLKSHIIKTLNDLVSLNVIIDVSSKMQ